MTGRGWVVLCKEFIDNLRDRRSIAMALLVAVMGPLSLIPVLHMVGHLAGEPKTLHLPVQGAELAPGLMEYLRARDIEPTSPPADPEAAVRAMTCDVVVIIPPSYPAELRAGEPATVRLVADLSRSSASSDVRRVEKAIEAYSGTVGGLRLLARGVSASVVTAIALATDDVATPESKGAALLVIAPMFLLLALFSGGIYIAVDVTAGERERGSLEPLMATPASAAEIVLGKLGAVMLFALETAMFTDIGFALVINLVSYPEIPGMKIELGVVQALEMLAILFPLVLPVAALQMLLASLSRTVKEAFTTLSIGALLPTLPGLFLAFAPFKTTLASMTIPLFAQNLLINEVLRGGALHPLQCVVAAATSLALGLLLASLAVARCASVRLLSTR